MTMENEKNVSSKIKTKKMNTGIRFFLSVVIIFILGYVILNYVPFISKYESVSIQTGSMDPIIKIDDLVIIDTSVSLDDLNEGDIIAFYAPLGDNIVIYVHYLSSITETDGVRTYKTKPEVSDQIDNWDLVDEDIIGIHVLTVPKIGSFLLFAQSTIGKVILVIDIVVLYLLVEFLSSSKNKSKNSIEEETEKIDDIEKEQ
jgi:signal peptidase